jgi:hypothetical protein
MAQQIARDRGHPSAEGTPPGGSTTTLTVGARVLHKERIHTSPTGSVQLLFLDKSTLSIAPNTSLVIDEFVYDPASNQRPHVDQIDARHAAMISAASSVIRGGDSPDARGRDRHTRRHRHLQSGPNGLQALNLKGYPKHSKRRQHDQYDHQLYGECSQLERADWATISSSPDHGPP